MSDCGIWIEPSRNDGTVGYLQGYDYPVAYTSREGGNWIAVPSNKRVRAPAAVLFADGQIFDCILHRMSLPPWRKLRGPHKPSIRIPMGRAVA